MFYDVRISQTKPNKKVVIVRKVFPKKRKRNKVAGLERNYVTHEKKYIVTDKLTLHVPANGRVIYNYRKGSDTHKLGKGDTLTIYCDSRVFWNLSTKKKYCEC